MFSFAQICLGDQVSFLLSRFQASSSAFHHRLSYVYIYIFNILQTTKSLTGVFHLRNLREDSHCDSCYVSSGLKLPSNFLFHASQEILGHQSIGVSPKALTIHVTYDIFTYIHQHVVVFAIHIACIIVKVMIHHN